MAATKAGIKVFRPTITANQMIGTVEALQHYRSVYGLNSDALEVLVKFERELVDMQYGTDKAAYITKGRKESGISLESLGSSTEEVSSIGKYNNSPEMDDATNAQLMWMIEHPEVPHSETPHVNEFKRGGKYASIGIGSNEASNTGIEGNRNVGMCGGTDYSSTNHQDGNSSMRTGSNSDSGINLDDSGSTDCFIAPMDLLESADAALASELFKSLE